MQTFDITIPNWAKYNPRSDRTITVWFRMQNDFFLDQKLWGMTDCQRLLYLFILCEASKIQSPNVQINISYVSTLRKCSAQNLIKDLQALIDLGVLHPPNGGLNPDTIPVQYNTNKQYNIAQSELERVYAKYPRKEGKSRGMKIVQREIKTPEDLEALSVAITNFSEKKKTLDPKFIPHFSTFMGEWRDWLDPTHGSVGVVRRALL